MSGVVLRRSRPVERVDEEQADCWRLDFGRLTRVQCPTTMAKRSRALPAIGSGSKTRGPSTRSGRRLCAKCVERWCGGWDLDDRVWSWLHETIAHKLRELPMLLSASAYWVAVKRVVACAIKRNCPGPRTLLCTLPTSVLEDRGNECRFHIFHCMCKALPNSVDAPPPVQSQAETAQVGPLCPAYSACVRTAAKKKKSQQRLIVCSTTS